MTTSNNVTPNSETSTEDLAREIHRSSWKHNDGRTVLDIPLFDALSEPAKIQLLDVACAVEVMMDRFRDEDERLLRWNMAHVMWDAYHLHPFCHVPHLPFEGSPSDVRRLWEAYAQDAIDMWWLVKDKPRLKPNINIEVSER